jgi:predicted Zn-dependent protease
MTRFPEAERIAEPVAPPPGRRAARSPDRQFGRRPTPAPRASGYLVFALLFAALTLACSTVPVTGRRSFNIVPDSQAEQLGADAYRQVLSGSRLITSGPDYDRVVRVGHRIAEVSDSPHLAWEFNLIDDPKTVNAFCLSGGKVAVYSGILPVTKDDAGLAVVVSHEIAHAIARHGSERMTDELALQFGQVGLAELLGGKSEQSRNLVLAAFGAGAQVGVMLPFSRSQESEADHIGLAATRVPQYAPGAGEPDPPARGAHPRGDAGVPAAVSYRERP